MSDHLEPLVRSLYKDLNQTFSWDQGLGTALVVFESDARAAVVAAIEPHLGSTWTHTSIGEAPQRIQDLIGGLGGLRAGQWLMHSEVGDTFVVALFWPWGGGSPISLRVGIVGGDDAADAQLKSWLGVS